MIERAWIGKNVCIGGIKHINIMPEGEDNNHDDEFYGDQESDASPDSVLSSQQHQSSSLIPNNQFGNIANHEYKSREESIKTLSYLDGYDEMKEVRIQDGFSFGYKSSFHDAYKIGSCLGSVCAQAALDDLLVKTNIKDTTTATDDKGDKIEQEALPPPHKSTATIIRIFLRDEILIGSTKEEDAQKRYNTALSKLKNDIN